MVDFPNQVNTQPALAVEGDFASTNPRFTVDAGPGGLVAGPSGVTVGRFCWFYTGNFDIDDTPQQVSNQMLTAQPNGTTNVTGFVHREQQGLITTYLQASGMLIPAGFPVTVFSGGDFFVKNAGTNEAILGQKAYASFANGTVTFAATGLPTTGTATGSIGPQTVSFTGSIAGNVLTVSAVSSGTLVAGAILTGGTGIVTNTTITSQLSGTAGGVGTYAVNVPEQTVASAALTGTYGLLNVSVAPASGTLSIGQTLTGSGVTAGTFITQLGTGTGGLGTYYVSPTQTVGSITLTFAQNVETKWIAMSGGQPGELVKISSHPLG
jgi:hypothetical protein